MKQTLIGVNDIIKAREQLFYNKNVVDVLKNQKSADIGGIYIDFTEIIRPESNKLYIILNGAQTREYPQFSRITWASVMDGTVINIADPTYKYYPNIKVGYYLLYRDKIEGFIRSKMYQYGIDNANLFFYGSSAGGSTGIYLSSRFPGSTCFAINPQLLLENRLLSSGYSEQIGMDDSDFKRFYSESFDNISIMEKNSKNFFILIENIASDEDKYFTNILQKRFDLDLNYPLTIKDNIMIWCYCISGDNPHSIQENVQLYPAIYKLYSILKHSEDVTQYLPLYLSISELWNKSQR